jgi:putative PIN family toxin of toxin-antitoxin system
MTRERVVLDTNVLISGMLSTTSTTARCVDVAITQGQLVATHASLRELTAKLLSPKFDRYVSQERRELLLLRLAPLVEIVEVLQEIRQCRDPDDDKFLEAAVNGRADVLVSGDRDLLSLHPFRGIAVMAPSDYVAGRARLTER